MTHPEAYTNNDWEKEFDTQIRNRWINTSQCKEVDDIGIEPHLFRVVDNLRCVNHVVWTNYPEMRLPRTNGNRSAAKDDEQHATKKEKA